MKPAVVDPPEIHNTLWHGINGTTGWDIGANCGQTLPEMTGRFHTVHAFEPAAECRPWLDTWTRHRVTVWDYAVSDLDGDIELTALPDKIDTGQLVTAGTHGMEWNPEQPGAVTRTVPARTVDSIAEQLGIPDFLKIDVEGHEMRVLAGAWQTLIDVRPDLLIEFHSPELHLRIQECLNHHGYRQIRTIRHPHYAIGTPMWLQHGWVRAAAE